VGLGLRGALAPPHAIFYIAIIVRWLIHDARRLRDASIADEHPGASHELRDFRVAATAEGTRER